MFTGIVEELGEVTGRDVLSDAARLTIRGPVVTSDAGHGDSILRRKLCSLSPHPAGFERLQNVFPAHASQSFRERRVGVAVLIVTLLTMGDVDSGPFLAGTKRCRQQREAGNCQLHFGASLRSYNSRDAASTRVFPE